MFCISPPQGGLSSVVYVKVDLVDINDNRPTFYPLSYAVSLSTQSAPGTSVVRVMAYDPDTGENGRVTYRTAPGGASPYFTLNKDTGWFNHIFFPPVFSFSKHQINSLGSLHLDYNYIQCGKDWLQKALGCKVNGCLQTQTQTQSPSLGIAPVSMYLCYVASTPALIY